MERGDGHRPSICLSYQHKPRRSHKLRLLFRQNNLRENISLAPFLIDVLSTSQSPYPIRLGGHVTVCQQHLIFVPIFFRPSQ